MKKILFFTVAFFVSATSFSQILDPVKWSYASKRISDTEAVVLIKATMDKGRHIYSQTVPKDGPQPTSFSFNSNNGYKLKGKTNEPKPIIEFEKAFNMGLGYFENSVVFQQRIDLLASSPTVKGKVVYMACNDTQCLPPEEVEFSIPIK